MSMSCDPKGKCPACGYPNGAGAQRCVRCRAILHVPQSCSGSCTKCHAASSAGQAEPAKP